MHLHPLLRSLSLCIALGIVGMTSPTPTSFSAMTHTVDDEVAEDGVAVRDQGDQEEGEQVQGQRGQQDGLPAEGVADRPLYI